MTLAIKELKKRLNSNPEFSSSSKFFDGIILLETHSWSIWMKIFMGRVIVATEEPFPFGYTFAIRGSSEGWRIALDPRKNRLREALYNRILRIEGNILEYNRMGKAVHGLTEVLREMVCEGLITIEEKK
jgi:hypothetical protein